MNIEILQSFLGWCSVINIAVLLYWAFFLLFAPNWTYQYSTKWLELSREHFNSIHFTLFGAYKLIILFFNIIPYFALRIIA